MKSINEVMGNLRLDGADGIYTKQLKEMFVKMNNMTEVEKEKFLDGCRERLRNRWHNNWNNSECSNMQGGDNISGIKDEYREIPVFEENEKGKDKYQVLVGFESWHKSNPMNKHLETWEAHNNRHMEEINEFKSTGKWIKREQFFKALKNNEIGTKKYEKKICEFIEKENPDGLF